TDEPPAVCAAPSTRRVALGAGGTERLEPARPPLEGEGADTPVRGRRSRQVAGRTVDEDPAPGGAALEPGGHVHEVAGDHPLAERADGDGRLPGRDGGPRL